jgi:hypothetical protein
MAFSTYAEALRPPCAVWRDTNNRTPTAWPYDDLGPTDAPTTPGRQGADV